MSVTDESTASKRLNKIKPTQSLEGRRYRDIIRPESATSKENVNGGVTNKVNQIKSNKIVDIGCGSIKSDSGFSSFVGSSQCTNCEL